MRSVRKVGLVASSSRRETAMATYAVSPRAARACSCEKLANSNFIPQVPTVASAAMPKAMPSAHSEIWVPPRE